MDQFPGLMPAFWRCVSVTRSARTVRTKVIAVLVGVGAVGSPALADAIDGNWCHADGRHFAIRGSEIVTPGGTRMEGNYSRHWYSYTVPATEPGAGRTIFMTLANENTVHLRLGEGASSLETWLRCSPSVSSLDMSQPS